MDQQNLLPKKTVFDWDVLLEISRIISKEDVHSSVAYFLLDFQADVFEVSIYLMHPVLPFFCLMMMSLGEPLISIRFQDRSFRGFYLPDAFNVSIFSV